MALLGDNLPVFGTLPFRIWAVQEGDYCCDVVMAKNIAIHGTCNIPNKQIRGNLRNWWGVHIICDWWESALFSFNWLWKVKVDRTQITNAGAGNVLHCTYADPSHAEATSVATHRTSMPVILCDKFIVAPNILGFLGLWTCFSQRTYNMRLDSVVYQLQSGYAIFNPGERNSIIMLIGQGFLHQDSFKYDCIRFWSVVPVLLVGAELAVRHFI